MLVVRYLFVILVMVLALVCVYATASETDVAVPCVGCPEFAMAPHPDSGIWYNPAQPGTGFVLTLQGRRVAGYFYLYSEEGAPEWLLFTADLEPAEEPGTHWVLEADLERIVAGACLNCEYKEAEVDEVAGQIRFEFLQANLARFQVGDGEPQLIRTLPFGWDIATVFPGQPDYLVPDLEGYWSLAVLHEEGMMYSRGFQLVDFSHSHDIADGELNIILAALSGRPGDIQIPVPPNRAGGLYCGSFEDISGPVCEITLDDLPDERFLLPLGNLGGSRIQAESDSGLILHAYRSHLASKTDVTVPCVGFGCPEFIMALHPDSGIWYNPAQSGTGFVLTLQGQTLAGYYYLYSDDGAPEWLLFTADLEPSEEAGAHWVLEADLERIVAGTCLNCEYKEAEVDGVAGQIRFEFLQANLARFQVGDGVPQLIRTLPFGWDIATVFPGQPDYPVPDLEGYWSIALLDEEGMVYSRGFQLVDFSHSHDVADGDLHIMLASMAMNAIPTPEPFEPAGDLYCGSSDDIAGRVCEITLDDFPNERFLLRPENLGGSRIQAESDSGLILHAYRFHIAE